MTVARNNNDGVPENFLIVEGKKVGVTWEEEARIRGRKRVRKAKREEKSREPDIDFCAQTSMFNVVTIIMTSSSFLAKGRLSKAKINAIPLLKQFNDSLQQTTPFSVSMLNQRDTALWS